jgi:hypothetical protein
MKRMCECLNRDLHWPRFIKRQKSLSLLSPLRPEGSLFLGDDPVFKRQVYFVLTLTKNDAWHIE